MRYGFSVQYVDTQDSVKHDIMNRRIISRNKISNKYKINFFIVYYLEKIPFFYIRLLYSTYIYIYIYIYIYNYIL